MAHAPQPTQDTSGRHGSRGFMRADAAASRERILAAAAALLEDKRVSMAELAAAAGVARSPDRQKLDSMVAFGAGLPRLRSRVARD